MKRKLILLICIIFLSGCDVLIKDDPKTGINYIPIEYDLKSIDYISDYNNNEISWEMKPVGSIDVELTIVCPLTDRTNIKVLDLKQSEDEIIVKLKGPVVRNDSLQKPVIKIVLRGINPYNKQNYKLRLDSDFDFLRPNMDTDTAKAIIKETYPSIIYDPLDIKLMRTTKGLMWTLYYPLVDQDKENVSIRFAISDSSKEIVNENKFEISKKIPFDKSIGFASGDFFLYKQSDDIYFYNIPKNESLKINKLKEEFTNIKRDPKTSKIYFQSCEPTSKFYIFNPETDDIKTFDLRDLYPDDFAVYDDKFFFITNNSTSSKLFKSQDSELEEIKQMSFLIKSIATNGKDLVIETLGKDGNLVYRIDSNYSLAFLGKGTKPVINSEFISYLSQSPGSNNPELIVYSLKSGLNKEIMHGNIKGISYDQNDNLIIKEKIESTIKLSIYKNQSIKTIVQLPCKNIFYSAKTNSLMVESHNNLLNIDLLK